MTAEVDPSAITMQGAILVLQEYWTSNGCALAQPFNTEVGAGTMNPATILRVLGPEPWRVAYVEPSVRPDDSRYGQNPNRLQTHTQFQVVLKPEPGNPQELYLASLAALGLDTIAHDVRFVEDNWAQPAIGAWGLGWEVWLDGMEITQFTYFQQVGGHNLDPVSVEMTYGLERILMAVQGVTHFKDLRYAPGLTYGEVFGQSEYEMSRYYLDVADVERNRLLYGSYIDEATRLLDERLPVPAHAYVLKSSHAFNVLDARGAIGTTERARAFATMRRLSQRVSDLWIERREELGYPLLPQSGESPAGDLESSEMAAGRRAALDADAPFVLEIGVEELPPHVVDESIESLLAAAVAALGRTTLRHGDIVVTGTPRRLVLSVASVAPQEDDSTAVNRGPRVSAAWTAGQPTKALEGFARSQGIAVSEVGRRDFGGTEHVVAEVFVPGRAAGAVLAEMSAALVSGLSADRNMRWSNPTLSFSRPVRWLVALLGDDVVPVRVAGLEAGRRTYLQRRAEGAWHDVGSAAQLFAVHRADGIVTDRVARRGEVARQIEELAGGVGGHIDLQGESALLDEVTNLVEAPRGIRGDFDARYLELPHEVLTTVMRKHQRYFPVLDDQGGLLAHFVTVASGDCDEHVVRVGNESVLRARYEDAAFFWRADLEVPLDRFRGGLSKLTFEERLGSVAERATRIAAVADALAAPLDLDPSESATLQRAGELVHFDLSTSMVVELSSLAGTMAREYARRAGEDEAVACALYEVSQPRVSGGELPVTRPGALLSIADRADLLVAMLALGSRVTGSSDPFGLRRAALGIVRILAARDDLGDLDLPSVLRSAAEHLRAGGIEVDDAVVGESASFAGARFEQLLRADGVDPLLTGTVDLLDPRRGAALLDEIAELRSDPAFLRLVAGLNRIVRLVPEGTATSFDPAELREEQDAAFRAVVDKLPDCRRSSLRDWIAEVGDLGGTLERYFDGTLVMAEDPGVRASRLGLLATVLVRSPQGVLWRDLGSVL